MSISFNELTFSDIRVIDSRALNEIIDADSYRELCQAYFEQALMPLSMISLNAYLKKTNEFLFAVSDNLYKMSVELFSFLTSLFLIFEENKFNNLIYSLEQILKYIAKVVLEVCSFALLCALTLISLPVRMLSTLVCYTMAIVNAISSNFGDLRTYSNYSNIDTRINSISNSFDSNERNSCECFDDGTQTLADYFEKNPQCV